MHLPEFMKKLSDLTKQMKKTFHLTNYLLQITFSMLFICAC